MKYSNNLDSVLPGPVEDNVVPHRKGTEFLSKIRPRFTGKWITPEEDDFRIDRIHPAFSRLDTFTLFDDVARCGENVRLCPR